MLKLFLPDHVDVVDPSFCFKQEVREGVHKDDYLYAHEVLAKPTHDGILISYGSVYTKDCKYSPEQLERLPREGARKFFRLEPNYSSMEIMGDCGAFSWISDYLPPITNEELVKFYTDLGVTYGASLDHIICGFGEQFSENPPEDFVFRQRISLENARTLMEYSLPFTPLGSAQGWDCESYAHSVSELQSYGYSYIGLGGMTKLRTKDIMKILEAVKVVLKPSTSLHLFGIARGEECNEFYSMGVRSIDSTSPLRQAFLDRSNNYHIPESCSGMCAVRVPQTKKNAQLRRKINAGLIDEEICQKIERKCLDILDKYSAHQATLDDAMECLTEYERFREEDMKRIPKYYKTLQARPWEKCDCKVCQELGIHVIIFRGSDRNLRRGFHNIHVLKNKLRVGWGQMNKENS